MKSYMIMVLLAGCFAMNTFAQSSSGSTPLAIENPYDNAKKGDGGQI